MAHLATTIAKVLFTFTGCFPFLKIITKNDKPAKTACEVGARLGYLSVASSENQSGGPWWQGCVVGALHRHGSGCVPLVLCFRATNAVFFTSAVSLGGRNQRRVGGLSMQRLAGGEHPHSSPPITVGRGEGELCVLSCLSTTRNACAWGLPGMLSCHADGFHDTTFST